MAESAWAERPATRKGTAARPATSRWEACPEVWRPQRAVLFRPCRAEFSELAFSNPRMSLKSVSADKGRLPGEDLLSESIEGFERGGGKGEGEVELDCTPKVRHKVKGPNTVNGERYGFGPTNLQPRIESRGDVRDRLRTHHRRGGAALAHVCHKSLYVVETMELGCRLCHYMRGFWVGPPGGRRSRIPRA